MHSIYFRLLCIGDLQHMLRFHRDEGDAPGASRLRVRHIDHRFQYAHRHIDVRGRHPFRSGSQSDARFDRRNRNRINRAISFYGLFFSGYRSAIQIMIHLGKNEQDRPKYRTGNSMSHVKKRPMLMRNAKHCRADAALMRKREAGNALFRRRSLFQGNGDVRPCRCGGG